MRDSSDGSHSQYPVTAIAFGDYPSPWSPYLAMSDLSNSTTKPKNNEPVQTDDSAPPNTLGAETTAPMHAVSPLATNTASITLIHVSPPGDGVNQTGSGNDLTNQMEVEEDSRKRKKDLNSSPDDLATSQDRVKRTLLTAQKKSKKPIDNEDLTSETEEVESSQPVEGAPKEFDLIEDSLQQLEEICVGKSQGDRIKVDMQRTCAALLSTIRSSLVSLRDNFEERLVKRMEKVLSVKVDCAVDRALKKHIAGKTSVRVPAAKTPNVTPKHPIAGTSAPPTTATPAKSKRKATRKDSTAAAANPQTGSDTDDFTVVGTRKSKKQAKKPYAEALRTTPAPSTSTKSSTEPSAGPTRKKRPRRRKRAASPRKGVLVKPDGDQTVEQLKAKLQSELSPGSMGIGVKRLITSREGMRVEVAEADVVKLKAAVAEKGFRCSDLSDHRNPRLVLYDINGDDPESILQSIKTQNLKLAAENIKFVGKFKGREGATNFIIEVSGATRKLILDSRRIFVGWQSCRVADYCRLTLCYRCMEYGHTGKTCTGKARCLRCAADHERTSCPKKEDRTAQRCASCLDAKLRQLNHLPGTPACPVYNRKLGLFKATINYG